MRPLAAFASLLLLGAAPPARPSYPPPTAEEQSRLGWVAARGRLLFEIDRAAWVGTDDMRARIPNADSSGMRGYIVERDGAGYAVTFFGGPRDAPVAFYRGRVENNGVVGRDIFPADARPPLTPAQRRLAAFRDVADGLGRRPCGGRPFNIAAIPPETPDGPIDLYLLTPQVESNEYPAGGHYRFTIAADGSILSSRAFTNSCITLGEGNRARPDEQPVALFITHILDRIPTEIHVFTSLSAHVALGVATIYPDRSGGWPAIASCLSRGRIERGHLIGAALSPNHGRRKKKGMSCASSPPSPPSSCSPPPPPPSRRPGGRCRSPARPSLRT